MKKILSLLICSMSGLAWASADVGKPAPDFALTGSDGKIHKLSELKGKQVIVLEWFNSGCPYVRKHYESGNMQRLQQQYAGPEVAWFTVASSAKGKQGHLSDSAEAAKAYKDLHMKSTALLLDPNSEVARAFGAKTTPHMFVINKKGLVAYNGAIDSENTARPMKLPEYLKNTAVKRYLEDAVNAVKAGKDVAVSSSDPYGCSVKYP